MRQVSLLRGPLKAACSPSTGTTRLLSAAVHSRLGLQAHRKPSTNLILRSSARQQQTTLHTSTQRLTTAIAPDTPEPASPEAVYSPPETGIISYLPASWVPYAELTRIDKPAGTYYLFFPCLFSTLMAAPMAMPMASPGSVIGTSLLFFSGALIMRGAGCSINDLWDRNLDPHVTRTKFRPIARGAITPFKGFAFTGAQLLAGLGILVQFPTSCLFYGIPSLLFVVSYPLAKRVTYYPQAVLGLTFSWGAMMGFPALGIDLLSNSAALTAAALLYTSNVAWTILYDMIYAHMDIKDDVKAGIKSIALKHDAETKQVLTGLAAVQLSLLSAAGFVAGAGPTFFIGSVGGAAVTLGIMIKRVNLKSVKDCWWWFINGCWITGGVISLGLAADYTVRYVQDGNEEAASEKQLD
ncbi:4-hydroxybenzoate polyprenyl transferase [Colletotrichum orchidophilum]|uniref:4-hydroxybenzoate polyprenyltransferase, mitochondrial n=1 Tax=Colletotrichum orchidophilum TaxID=1209926 RepID=A0A1G4B464_9PEZI|nr:4-hydroxybenzoate polyprenyl transferase [Colletotrichum orchidophilum]OHE96184.1 4-hydroxybenzoate polyprenyl transferase [Colletotrichum orchidophilum]